VALGIRDREDLGAPSRACHAGWQGCPVPAAADPQTGTWSEEREMSAGLHVHPLDDLIEHTLDDECPCIPEDRPVEREDGSVGWLAVHHSLDGRERYE
jgi:hypothetical protein